MQLHDWREHPGFFHPPAKLGIVLERLANRGRHPLRQRDRQQLRRGLVLRRAHELLTEVFDEEVLLFGEWDAASLAHARLTDRARTRRSGGASMTRLKLSTPSALRAAFQVTAMPPQRHR